MRPPWQMTAEGVRLSVRLSPKADRDALCGVVAGASGQMLAARVRAAPRDGKANEALRELLALELGMPKRAVTITRGSTSRFKLVEIEGSSETLVSVLTRLAEQSQ